MSLHRCECIYHFTPGTPPGHIVDVPDTDCPYHSSRPKEKP